MRLCSLQIDTEPWSRGRGCEAARLGNRIDNSEFEIDLRDCCAVNKHSYSHLAQLSQ